MRPTPDACGVRRTARHRLGLLLIGVAAFLVAGAGLRSLQGPLKAPTLRAPVEAFLAEKDEIDAVFVGSSRVQRGVWPEVIDAQLSSPEREFRSFNLGIPGMKSFEADWLVRRILASNPERLRFLVIEAPLWRPEIVAQHDFTARYVDWHDARATWLVLRAIWRSRVPWQTKVALAWKNLRFFGMRTANYATKDRFSATDDPVWNRLVLGWGGLQGYQPLHEKTPQGVRRRRRFLTQQDAFEKNVARIRRFAEKGQLAEPGGPGAYDQASLEEQAAQIREAGVTPVYFVPPVLLRGPDFAALESQGVIDHLIDLRSPLDHPDLFAAENRFDREHMNEKGARLMSERIASELGPIVLHEEGDDAASALPSADR